MKVSATLKQYRSSARKVRAVCVAVRGMEVSRAKDALFHSSRRAASAVKKLVESAEANARNNFHIQSDMYVRDILVGEGATLKRWMPRAHGRSAPIRKRTAHITVVLEEKRSET